MSRVRELEARVVIPTTASIRRRRRRRRVGGGMFEVSVRVATPYHSVFHTY